MALPKWGCGPIQFKLHGSTSGSPGGSKLRWVNFNAVGDFEVEPTYTAQITHRLFNIARSHTGSWDDVEVDDGGESYSDIEDDRDESFLSGDEDGTVPTIQDALEQELLSQRNSTSVSYAATPVMKRTPFTFHFGSCLWSGM